MKKAFLLTFDLEEFDRIKGERGFQISYRGAEKVMDILEKMGICATFFTTASFARRYPNMLRALARKNEIALHAYRHSENYRTMPPPEAENLLRKGKKFLENIIGERITGFRAPQMQAPDMHVLKKVGLSYDSSIHPTTVPGRYNGFREKRKIRIEEGVVRVPISVTPIFRMAFSWLWFRALGVNYAKFCTQRAGEDMNYVCIYFHPWDFVDLRGISELPFLYSVNTHRSHRMLEIYLQWLKKKGYQFTTVGGFLRDKGFL